MAAGQLGGQLYPTYELSDQEEEKKVNLSFGEAIQEWNKHDYKKAVKLFRKHIEDFPDSPWASEAVLHIGCDATYNGRYTEAEASFNWILDKNKESSYEGAKKLIDKATLRLAVLKVYQNDFEKAKELFSKLKANGSEWRDRTYASDWIQRLSRYSANKLAMLNCGTIALARLMEEDGRKADARAVAELLPRTTRGHSIKDLADIAAKYGYGVAAIRVSISDLKTLTLPAIVHINGDKKGASGHYWILEKIGGENLSLFDPQAGRRFQQSADEFSRGWSGNALVFSKEKDILQGSKLSSKEMGTIFGGCCGAPRPEDDLGDPGPDKGDSKEKNPCDQGAPVWSVNVVNMNFFMTDTPMWYEPPIGPSVRIRLSYNSQSAIAHSEPFGNKWQLNYGSYLIVDTAGNVLIFMPDGRRDVYVPDGAGGYTSPFGVFNNLTKMVENHFELRLLDGTVYVYNIPEDTNSLQPFLVEIRDPYGQRLTFGYNSEVQLTTITDAVGQVTSLSYTGNGLVDHINDPFGRSTAFQYDDSGNLTKITDMAGYWTQFSYDSDVYLRSFENPRGTWYIYTEPSDNSGANSDNYPPPGDLMWQNYRITVTNPLGGKEEYFYYGGCDSFTCSGYTWYVSPRDYIEWQSQTVNNFKSDAPKTRYFLTIVSGHGRIEKKLYPEGGYKSFQYDSVTGRPATVTDYHGTDSNGSPIAHTSGYTYNVNGLATSITDAMNELINITYYPNNIDVHTIDNGLGPITYTYNGDTHDVASVTDRLNNVTAYEYNSYGQLTRITEAQGTSVLETTGLIYDPATHYLTDIERAGNTILSVTRDNIGRVKTVTDATGMTLGYERNDLDYVTEILFPDTVYDGTTPTSKFVNIQRSSCCPHIVDSVTDRGGITTHYRHDALKRLTEVEGPNGTIGYDYDDNGNLTALTDADGKSTSFEYNLDDRLAKKTYADGKFVKYDYDLAGLLTKVTNARNIEKNYVYDADHNLLTISYSDSTPGVTFTYDDYNRVATRTDGTGLYQYSYDADNRVRTVNGPWTDDTVEFRYNELGQLTDLLPQGGQALTYIYDPIGRLTNIQSAANTFTYAYIDVNPLIQSLTRPNGSVTEYLYNDPLKRLTDVINKTSAEQVINSYSYAYNDLDLRSSETITNGTPITSFSEGVVSYDYNNLNQLLSSTNPVKTFIYDDDGNMTKSYTPEGYVMNMTYDGENRLTSTEFTDGDSILHRTEYFYSGDSLLAEKKKYEGGTLTADIRYVRAGFLPVQERDGSNTVTREYTWGLNYGGGIGGLLDLKQGGEDYSYLYDGKGNVTTLLDSTQNVVGTYTYDPFGVLMAKTGSLDQSYMFSTKEYDEETGLSYYGYRFYSPSLSRWITRDPISEGGGINLYGFVYNSPTNWADIFGLEAAIMETPYGPVPVYVPINPQDGQLTPQQWQQMKEDLGRLFDPRPLRDFLKNLIDPLIHNEGNGEGAVDGEGKSCPESDLTPTGEERVKPSTRRGNKGGRSVEEGFVDGEGRPVTRHTVYDPSGNIIHGPHYRPGGFK